jgi:Sel1 repeat
MSKYFKLILFAILAMAFSNETFAKRNVSLCNADLGLQYVGEKRFDEARKLWSSEKFKYSSISKVGIAALDIWSKNTNVDMFIKSRSNNRFVLSDVRKAQKNWIKCSQTSSPGAIILLGTIDLYGFSGETNNDKAERWFLSKEVSDHPIALLGLGDIYARRGDRAASRKVLLHLTESQNSISYRRIGDSFFYGGPFNIDYIEAAWWFTKAAESGDAYSQLILSDLYRLGKGVPKNLEESRRWYDYFLQNKNKQPNTDEENFIGKVQKDK